ncbi:Abi family protein [Xylocopilactobacillus apicola]|nr:Abi family protein [Xylocopilactobacillus apicola]
MNKGKSTDGLLRHIRKEHNINVNGRKDKLNLQNMGYYHGYKAYKFYRTKNRPFEIKDFSQINTLFEFDNQLKAFFYPLIMSVETSIKNRTIEVATQGNDPTIYQIFDQVLTRNKDDNETESKQKKFLRDKTNFRRSVDSLICNRYNSIFVSHYLHKDEPLPLWSIMELFSLGNVGKFLELMNKSLRIKLENSIGMYNNSIDQQAELLIKHVFILKPLRNSVAHNQIIFDCRFQDFDIRHSVKEHLVRQYGVPDISFDTITDYFLLILYYLKLFGITRSKQKKLIKDFSDIIDSFSKNINNTEIVDRVLFTNPQLKLEAAKNF